MGMKYESILNKVRGQIGVEWQVGVYEIEKGRLRMFVQAIGDPNPLWQDDEYAKKSGYGGIIAPSTFPVAICNNELPEQLLFPSSEAINAGNEVEFYQPIRPGDIITVTAKYTDVNERVGRMGKMGFIDIQITYTNQRQEVVAINVLKVIILEEVVH